MSINSGDTAFMMLCTAMVCLMTPGLAFFYGGLARKRSILFIMMESFISMGIVTLIWMFGGFGLAFGKDIHGVIGRFTDYFGLAHVGLVPNAVHAASIPFALFFLFQLMFCVITVPLMTGAFAERLNLKGYILLLICWTILVYIPVCHWVWGEGFLSKWGFVDFAGGTVIHTTAGFAALASIFVLGKRKVAKQGMHPNNLMAAAIGTGLLWFGWFGFNSGGALSAGALATKAFTNTLVGLASGMIAWLIMAKILRGKINFVDVMTGSVAGLATITPCAGYIAPSSAIIVGIVAGIICNLAVGFRQKKGWDDALDVWGVHGVGGFTGTILIGLLADKTVNGVGASFHQLLVQVGGVVLTAIYAFVLTYVLLKILGAVTQIKPTQKQIEEGLDKTLLEETAYDKN
ncbi:ammonium transporter [Ligilactobacillus murinus]|jgi:Amt family ammonium transporter|uniref:Ammonium transporter n=1 Tax=Ligilactobacillus murinus TaxID=1622 RepID=A0A2Z4VYX4_9LACO|nr:ammonium transporter [Ligilactobacillus murinus]HBV48959.1 ammonium transporter [Lactobacillus sp.]AWZ39211.1 ammonium transporter [Ligilactobacillus murinus]AWZ40177.1 ammonium transporter [Ligilactobacillus murinus]MBF0700809.1 ammonium transporter [Ligilactobacillus murinus]MBF0759121.1 ammonium transporter [Ligilactobacillus murinus]